MSDDKLQDALTRASRAERLLNDDLLNEAFRTLEASYIQQWREAPPRDTIGREKLYLAINIVGKVQEHLSKALHFDGTVAKFDLNARQKKAG